jgi:hypothetical protein
MGRKEIGMNNARNRRIRNKVVAAAIAGIVMAGPAALAATQSQAGATSSSAMVQGKISQVAPTWLWSGSVTLQGTSHCGLPPTTWVWVQAPNGESGWATNGAGRYLKNFRSVPSGGMTVVIRYGESSFSCHDSVFVRRPLDGTGLTVNLVKVVPNG